MEEKIPFPRQAAPYRRIYLPGEDIYRGPDSLYFHHGQTYPTWVINDFTMVVGADDCWHTYGITHPKPPAYHDPFHFEGDVHDAEYQLFHCSFMGSLADIYAAGEDACTEHEKVLYPDVRQGRRECWAPCMVRYGNAYRIFWSPEEIRYATTTDMFHFQVSDTVLFSGAPYLRDPYIFEEDGVYTMLYLSDRLYARQSVDLVHWGEEFVAMDASFRGSMESPCLVKRHGYYYLLWCLHDGRNGCYDARTFVYASDRLFGWTGTAPVAMLEGHAPEILSQDGQDYLCSVAYPDNGLYLAPLEWC